MIAKKLLKLFEDYGEDIKNILGYLELSDLISVDYAEIDEEGDLIVSFLNNESDEEMTIAFGLDEDGTPVALYVDSEDDDGESEFVDLSELEIPVKDGKIDFDSISDWLSPEVLLDILDGTEDEYTEASIYVVRGGKKIKKNLVRKKRRKPLTAARRQAIRKAVISRRKSKAQAARKRAKSLKLRQRANLKRKQNSKMRVAY